MLLLQDPYDWQAQQRADEEVARHTDGSSLNWRGFVDQTNQIAHALVATGVQPGDRVAILAKNCLEFPAFYLGAAKAGAVLVPLNYRLAPNEWAYILADSGASLVIARGEYVAALEAIKADLAKVRNLVGFGADVPSEWLGLDAWTRDHPVTAPDVDLTQDHAVIQMYTSGTTGLPKGVVLTHRALTNQMMQIMIVSSATVGLRCQVVAPMYHVGATISTLSTLAAGGSIYVHEDFVPDEVVRVLDEEGIAQTFLVPAMIQALLVFVPGVAERSYKDLRLMSYGAAPIAEETLRQAIDVFGCEFGQGFGQTEATAMLTYLSARDHQRALSGGKPELLRSCGRRAPATTIKIVDDSGKELPPNTTGEIIASGPQLMDGYWQLPEATASALRDGWLHTGDAGYLDDEGYLYIQDRIKDMIVSGGENVYPAEVEQVLLQHSAVADAAAIGIPDEQWGEAVHACVVVRPGEELSADDLIAFCRDRLAGYKRPRSVDFVEAIPRNASMKILKRELRAPHWEGHDRAVH